MGDLVVNRLVRVSIDLYLDNLTELNAHQAVLKVAVLGEAQHTPVPAEGRVEASNHAGLLLEGMRTSHRVLVAHSR